MRPVSVVTLLFCRIINIPTSDIQLVALWFYNGILNFFVILVQKYGIF